MVTLTFMRHAESEYNMFGRFCGRIDCNITPQAMEKAKLFWENNSSCYDAIYCSPLKRTSQTLEVILPACIPIIDDRIIESSLGIWEGKSKSSVDQNLLYLFCKGKYLPSDAESISSIDARVKDFIQYIFHTYTQNENILVITHDNIMKSVKRNYINTSNISSKNLEMIYLNEQTYYFHCLLEK